MTLNPSPTQAPKATAGYSAAPRWVHALLAVGIAAGGLATASSSASARSADWTLWQPPVGAQVLCGDTVVDVDFPVNREYVRELSPTPGTVDIQQLTGSLAVRFTTAQKSVSYNIGGPGTVTFYADGTVQVRSEGHYNIPLSPEQAESLRFPQIANTTGLVQLLIHPDGSIDPVRLPHHVTSVCADLGL